MRTVHAVRLTILAMVLLCPPLTGWTATDDKDAADVARAIKTFDKGDPVGGLAIVEGVLSHSPENLDALYRSAQINFQLNNIDAARGRLDRLVKLSGSYFAAWELMVQVSQAQGDLTERNEAIKRLKIAITSAIDPSIREKADFIRDVFRTGAGDVMAVDYFERGGSDFTRYQFALGDPRSNPDKGLLLRTDEDTTQTWSNTALLPQDKQLFHLDMVDPKPEGGENVAIYEYYVGEPDYDTVRAKVLQILRGEAKPLSGEPGSLSGIIRR
jgi:tetratricopeptide (TPR) repeat protein